MGPQTGTEVAAVPAQRRIIAWDPEGNPVLIVQPVLTKQQIKSVYFAAAAEPFAVDDRPDAEKYRGMTVVEVMVRKQVAAAIRLADVDPSAIEAVMDRLIDRPVSKSENLNMGMSYEEVLKEIRRRSAAPPGPRVVDVPAGDEDVFGDLA